MIGKLNYFQNVIFLAESFCNEESAYLHIKLELINTLKHLVNILATNRQGQLICK